MYTKQIQLQSKKPSASFSFQSLLSFSPCIVSLNACICERWKCACIGLCAYVWESLLWVQIRIQRSALSALSVTDRSHLPHSFCCCQQADCQYEAKMQQHLLLRHFFLYTLSCFYFSFPWTVCSLVISQQCSFEIHECVKIPKIQTKAKQWARHVFPGKTLLTQQSCHDSAVDFVTAV